MDDNDHRRLGRQLDLYHFEEHSPGMVFWHARGHVIYRELENFLRRRMRRLGYQEVRTPQLLPRSLWERSGHWEKFRDAMFVFERPDDEDLVLKPMSCPCHLEIFNDRIRSWRELPMRMAEFGACHRNEPSGSMHGLMRTRAFEQDDAHVLCAPDQVRGEVARFVGMLRDVYAELGFPEPEVILSLRPEMKSGSDADWDHAEQELLEAAHASGLTPRMAAGEGAFYGPKLEFVLRDGQGRSWQCGTVQLDMVLPGRLGASYIDRRGDRTVPVMIHHAILGSMGRFIGILLEDRGGRLPFWLAPDQVAVLPISSEQQKAAAGFCDQLLDAGVRAVMFDQAETLSRRIVMARENAIPVNAVIGAREVAAGQVSLKENGRQRSMGAGDAVSELVLRTLSGPGGRGPLPAPPRMPGMDKKGADGPDESGESG